MTNCVVMDGIWKELARAKALHPKWPFDKYVHQAAIVGEEAGSLLKAALDYEYGRTEGLDALAREAMHVAAMAIRLLDSLSDPLSELKK